MEEALKNFNRPGKRAREEVSALQATWKVVDEQNAINNKFLFTRMEYYLERDDKVTFENGKDDYE
jgi:hypothetical protein